MNTLERRIDRLERVLRRRMFYIALRHRTEARAEELRRSEKEVRAAAKVEAQAREVAEKAKQQAEDTPRAAEPPRLAEPRVVAPPPHPPKPKPPPWTYDPPPEMQIRPVSWRRSELYDDGSEDNYGWTIHEYDPLEREYDDDS
jgi:hypothetical protein